MKPLRVSRFKYSPLLVAVLVLILTPAIPTQAASGDEALLAAAVKGDAAKVKSLLAQGADVNHKDKEGFTALIRAALSGHVEVVKILLAECASKDCQLYPFRFGVNPYNSRTGRKLTGEAKEKARRIAIGNLSKIGVAPN